MRGPALCKKQSTRTLDCKASDIIEFKTAVRRSKEQESIKEEEPKTGMKRWIDKLSNSFKEGAEDEMIEWHKKEDQKSAMNASMSSFGNSSFSKSGSSGLDFFT